MTHTTALVSSLSLVSEGGTDEYNYTYDNLGNILTVSKNGALVESYEYDSLNQLTRENNLSAGYTKLYTYDPMGNITQKVELAYTTAETSTLDTSNGTVTSYGYVSGGLLPWGDRLVNYNGTAITYDNIGNPLNWRNASELNWSARELVSANLSNGNTVSYTYNADGIRTQKVYNNTVHNYTLDGSKIIKETVSGEVNYEFYYIYDASGSVIGFHYNNAPYYFLKNLQGDIVSIVNAMGTVVVEYTYDAWGKVLTTTGTLASTIGTYNPFRYRGYYYDSETGFYYLQSRYYDPVVGRFLNADGIIGANGDLIGYNMFAYCSNNPVIGYDPSGRGVAAAADTATATAVADEVLSKLPLLATIFLDGPYPVVDIVVIALAVGSFFITTFPIVENSVNITVSPIETITDILTSLITPSKDKDLVITSDAVEAEAEREKAKQKITPYQVATREGGKVILGSYITLREAISYIMAGFDIMCATSQDAYNLVWRFGPNSFFYEIDKGKEGVPGYYYHFHLRENPGVHIWHKGAGNSEYRRKYPR